MARDFARVVHIYVATDRLTVNFNLVLSLDGYLMTLVFNLSYRFKGVFVVPSMTSSNRLS
jgi:hypothetical protein